MALVNGNTHAALGTATPAGDCRKDGFWLERTTGDIVAVSAGLPFKRLFGLSYFNDFLGVEDVPTTGDTTVNVSSPLYVKDTSAAGAPTKAVSADADNGAYELKFAATDEAEILTLYCGDEQNLDPTAGPVAIFRLKLAAQLLAQDTLVFGLAAAQNDAADSVTSNAWFRMEGANLNILVESDDATTDSDDKDTSVDYVADTYYEFAVDATNYADVKFYIRTSVSGSWTDVTPSGTTFKLHATTNLQPFLQLQKSGGTHQTDLLIDYVAFHAKRI